LIAAAPVQAGFTHHLDYLSWIDARDKCAEDGQQLATFCNKAQFEEALAVVGRADGDVAPTMFDSGVGFLPPFVRGPPASETERRQPRPHYLLLSELAQC